MSEGFLQAGFSVPFAVDSSPEAHKTYTNRHKQLGYCVKFHCGKMQELLQEDILREFLRDVHINVIVGGPPCQGFSTSGKRQKNDPRNLLFLDFLKAIKIVMPEYFVMENVVGILSYKFPSLTGLDGELYCEVTAPEVIKSEALKFGYDVKYKILNAKHFGVPQHRPRVIFFGHKVNIDGTNTEDAVAPPEFPSATNSSFVSVQEAISDLRFLKSGQRSTKYDNRYVVSEYQAALRRGITPSIAGCPIASTELTNHIASRHSSHVMERFRLLRPGESVEDLLIRMSQQDRLHYATKKFRCSKLDRAEVAPTVVTLPDDIVHYDDDNPRILTVRELARLQSFDDSFEFLGKRTTGGSRRKFETPQYTQVGNAVPPIFAQSLAKQIMCALNKTHHISRCSSTTNNEFMDNPDSTLPLVR